MYAFEVKWHIGTRPGGPRPFAPGGFAGMANSLPAQNGLPARPAAPQPGLQGARPMGPGNPVPV